MRIAQVAPLYESVPPKWYGGTERVVSYLTEALVEQGHEVTLFASGDSMTAARLVEVCRRSLRLEASCIDSLVHHVRMLELVRQQAAEFDLIHFHIDYLHYPLSRQIGWRHVTTLHGRLDIPDLWPMYDEFQAMPLVSISDAQRRPLPGLNWQGTVYHGLPADLHTLRPEPGKYLAFLGRISPEKRVDRAIEIARRVGLPLKIAAKIDKADREYYESKIKPLFADPLIEYVGELGGRDKDEFLGNALALLFPIDWPEPFGLVMIEAMACGTPVIAWPCGSAREVVDEGITGFLVESLEDAVRAVQRVPELSRAGIRAVFDRRFSAPRMARDYVAIYERIVADARPSRAAARRARAPQSNGRDHASTAPRRLSQAPLIAGDYAG